MTNISLKEMSKVSSNTFVRYYELWVYNRVYKKIVVEDFHRLVQDVHLKKLSVKYLQTNPVLDFDSAIMHNYRTLTLNGVRQSFCLQLFV